MPLKNIEERRRYHNEWAKAWRKNNPEKYRAYRDSKREGDRLNSKRYHTELKREVMTAYSSEPPHCVCCNESRMAFLTIDHIDDSGAAHRRELRNRGGVLLYRWLKLNNWPTGFRTLCHNCNSGRAVNGGICPHEEERNEGMV